MHKAPVKLSFIERAKETHKFHTSRVRDNPKWQFRDTAKALGRSLGSIAEDMLIASWWRSHRDKIERFDYAREALAWIRQKQKEIELEEIE